jgi:hypothetical protein
MFLRVPLGSQIGLKIVEMLRDRPRRLGSARQLPRLYISLADESCLDFRISG